MAIVRRSDVPVFKRARSAVACLNKAGTLSFSVRAAQAFGTMDDFLALADYDEEKMVLTLSIPEKLPRGITERDLFHVCMRTAKGTKNPIARIYARGLLHQVGYQMNGKSRKLTIAAIDPVHRSISLVVPIEQPLEQSCDGSSN